MGRQQNEFSEILWWFGQRKLCHIAAAMIEGHLCQQHKTKIEVAPKLSLQRHAEEKINTGVLANRRNEDSR